MCFMVSARSIVTFTTDFGLADAYVAQMKAAVLRQCPEATLVDITHLVPPQDILAGSIALERAIAAFSPKTIHVAVVDPGVGTNRRLLLVRINGQIVLCPDNGIITWPHRRHGPAEFAELLWRPPEKVSATFHGRDILAPAAGCIASGDSIKPLAKSIDDPILLDIALAKTLQSGRIIYIDHFGNAITNIPSEFLHGRNGPTVRAAHSPEIPLCETYSGVAAGKSLALIGSADLLEIAVRNGSAAQQLSLKVGDEVTFA